jgi:hypothetical protein
MAAGKSTVAALLARRFDRAAHIGGDTFLRMVVTGRAAMTPSSTPEARQQLRLRYRQAAMVADAYVEAGFTADRRRRHRTRARELRRAGEDPAPMP